MGKGFLSGVLWGSASGIAVMAVLSLYAPLSAERELEVQAAPEAPVESSEAAPEQTVSEDTAQLVAEAQEDETRVNVAQSEAPAEDLTVAQTDAVQPETEEAEPPVAVVEPTEDKVEDIVIVEVTPAPKTEAASEPLIVIHEPADKAPELQETTETAELAITESSEEAVAQEPVEIDETVPSVQADAPEIATNTNQNATVEPRVDEVVEIEVSVLVKLVLATIFASL
ncbi:MAG: hypothetical protein OXC60_19485 [Litoreibacter sp.]|nr:hypothetical protein [Litoreibacter sp.]